MNTFSATAMHCLSTREEMFIPAIRISGHNVRAGSKA
jgi:hypothetical protein